MNRWNYLQAKLFFSSSPGNMTVPVFMLNSDICVYISSCRYVYNICHESKVL